MIQNYKIRDNTYLRYKDKHQKTKILQSNNFQVQQNLAYHKIFENDFLNSWKKKRSVIMIKADSIDLSLAKH